MKLINGKPFDFVVAARSANEEVPAMYELVARRSIPLWTSELERITSHLFYLKKVT